MHDTKVGLCGEKVHNIALTSSNFEILLERQNKSLKQKLYQIVIGQLFRMDLTNIYKLIF